MTITPPPPHEDHGFYNTYISLTDGKTDLVTLLHKTMDVLEQLIFTLSEEQLQYRYEPGKWNIKESVQHLIDAERNFCYRAMRISRGDQSLIPVLDIHSFVTNANVDERG